ncbi:SIR2 family protein [Dyella sp. GSA-30]|uniref:SIR2 family protein n=1 Tax=Dyella sp. GSA-30 TaxID=2994496 RepID=UPI002490195F|nr:SIR2 family protein [Dyella sp. GSA-30]BDU21633.1 hypothetical protein DYGSA30_30900 [Dyella sp. GSA-30]
MSIDVGAIYDKHLNLLIGSGASFGLLPTLALKVTRADNSSHTIETLATQYEQAKDKQRLTALFMHYYQTCILPAQTMPFDALRKDADRAPILAQYEQLVRTLLSMVQRRHGIDKRCNIFTTNYDGCLPHAANHVMSSGGQDFVVNDGSRGFFQRVVEARNYNTYFFRTGIFERRQQAVPQLNLINLHGSVYWSRSDERVMVSYESRTADGSFLDEAMCKAVAPFLQALAEGGKDDELPKVDLTDAQISTFWDKYGTLPIVNPTKWKFHETVFEEHYYQMLRLLSFELERENAVLITFGFSFADEHILNLVKRSLSNPKLMVFIACFNEPERVRLVKVFAGYDNVACVTAAEGNLDFAAFNAMLTTGGTLLPAGPVVGANA